MEPKMLKPDWETPAGVELYLGDCLDILPQFAPGSIHAVVTDPPYMLEMGEGGIGANRKYISNIRGFTDRGFDMSILDRFDNWQVFCGVRQLREMLEKASVRRWMLVTWNKPNPTPLCNGNYLPDTEYIVHSFPSGGLHGKYRDRSRYFVYPAQRDNWHPNEKPMPLMEKCIACASNRGETILDPFMGSGTTIVACIRTGRRAIGIEREKKYFDIAVERCKRELERFPLFTEEKKAVQTSLL
jgi:site-specific DNA-methyltransferase (adenine-specific)